MFNDNGQSMVEVIIAVTVAILVVTALTFTTIFSIRNASFAKNSALATKLAQEGIERVRTGRDRNSNINGLPNVMSWNGTGGLYSLWSYPISGNGLCDNSGGKCYFSVSADGTLTNIGFALASFPSTSAEPIPSTNPIFRRVVLLSDDPNKYDPFNQKEVTVIVRWTDPAGPHESKLVTILRKL